MVYTLRFFPSKCSLFNNSNVFCSCVIHILYTGCAKIKKNSSGAKRLNNAISTYTLFIHNVSFKRHMTNVADKMLQNKNSKRLKLCNLFS